MTILAAILIVCTLVVAGFAIVGLVAGLAEARLSIAGLVAICVAAALGWFAYQELGQVFEWNYIPISFAVIYAEYIR